ncbi:hypothetical protein P692DRAFT_20749938 [Suillus brevipes Sb2]|nr:hypothetical protein P692DRAFT_20749938 [Suillus brevipes Sb2]
MHPKPTQTGQWPIPGPSQHGHYSYPQIPQPSSVPSHLSPYPPDHYKYPYAQFAPATHPVYRALYPFPLPQHWGGYYPASQGVGVPLAPAQPSYPSAPPSVQPLYNQYPAQELEQQPPVVAVKESAVKRGKRKAVDLDDDAPPPKKKAIRLLVDGSHFAHIESKQHQNGRAQFPSPKCDKTVSRGDSSNVGGSSKTQEEAVAQVPHEGSTSNAPSEFFLDSFEDSDCTSSEPLKELGNSLEDSNCTSSEPLKELGNSLEDSDCTSNEPLKEPVNSLEDSVCTSSELLKEPINSLEDSNCTSSEPLKEPVNSLEQTKLACNEQLPKFFDIEKAADVASGQQLEVVNSPQETDNSASGEQSQEPVNSPDQTGDLAPVDVTYLYLNLDSY